MSGRDIEAEVLTKAALRLKYCQDHWEETLQEAKLYDALKHNQRIWTILQSELEKPENPLPAEIKNSLLRLNAFIDKRTLETIAYPVPAKLDILISINHNIAAGLRTRLNPVQSEKAAA
jgi:flagellar protein FlaF